MRVLVFLLAVSVGIAAAQSSNSSSSGNMITAYGPTILTANVPGKIRSFATSLWNSSDPLAVQVNMAGDEFTESILTLAQNGTNIMNQTIMLPDNMFELPVTHSVFELNSAGKAPITKDPVVILSHFLISEQMRSSIAASSDSSAARPADLPSDFICDNVTANAMGMACWPSRYFKHQVPAGGNSTSGNSTSDNSTSGGNSTSSNSTSLDHALGYLVYNGQIIGLQQLLDRKYLLTHPKNACADVVPPSRFVSSMWFPDQYCVRYWQGVYASAFERWSFYQASAGNSTGGGNSTST